jgi:hypothetical protein
VTPLEETQLLTKRLLEDDELRYLWVRLVHGNDDNLSAIPQQEESAA